MKRIIFNHILLLSFFFSIAITTSYAKPLVAFGYLHNESNNPIYNYLETIFPRSFASSIRAIFNVRVKKPHEIDERLKNRYDQELKKHYEYYELLELVEKIDADLFIFGGFKPLLGNRIRVTLKIYMDGHNEIFSFTNIGKMETDIIKLVDRITIIVINFMNEKTMFRSRKIRSGTRLAILSNLEGVQLNRFLITFLKKGYPVVCFQNNDIYNIIDYLNFKKFMYITTKKNSFDTITDWRKTKFFHSTWTGKRYQEGINHLKSNYNQFDLNYIIKKNTALNRLNSSFNSRIDVLLIVYFSNNRKKSWGRAIDIKKKELIWMESNIKSDILIPDPITNITEKIILGMTEDIKNPFMSNEKR